MQIVLTLPDQVPDTEVSIPFLQGMVNRMAMSYFKYGAIPDAKGKFDFIESLYKRLQLYIDGDLDKEIKAGNTEWLIDAANFAMIEFMIPGHPGAYFEGTDSDKSPGRKIPNGDFTVVANKEVQGD